ncbi:MAG: cobalamin biosynthesis protein, partial [Ruminiclostridium sp.]|nr:cobalamin biosynthesis protein [Ruminiclostridium sp.]
DPDAVPFTELSGLITEIFGRYDALIFVCSVGIAVRAVAPHIVTKVTDPAVVAVDDCGKFAVSLLSGHIGGANALAMQTAAKLGAVPVITTATDSGNKFSPDVFAKANALVIDDMDAAKTVASSVLDGEKIGLGCDYPHSGVPGLFSADTGCKTGIVIAENTERKPYETTLNMMPENIVVGIGCRKGTPCEHIRNAVTEVFAANHIDMRRISAVASIDIKAEEPGLREFCAGLGVPLMTFTAGVLMSAEGSFAHSDFVLETTGTDNVCERAVVSAGARLTVPKTAGNGVTCALGELPVYIDFEKDDVRCFI